MSSTPVRVIRDIDEARKLLKESSIQEKSEMSNEFTLKRFGIKNALSTFDKDWRRENIRQADRFIRTLDDGWKSLVDACRTYVRHRLLNIEIEQALNLREFVQCFVLRTVIIKIYPSLDSNPPSDHWLISITSRIVELYDLPDEVIDEIDMKKDALMATIG
jgi:hypothetical protein